MKRAASFHLYSSAWEQPHMVVVRVSEQTETFSFSKNSVNIQNTRSKSEFLAFLCYVF